MCSTVSSFPGAGTKSFPVNMSQEIKSALDLPIITHLWFPRSRKKFPVKVRLMMNHEIIPGFLKVSERFLQAPCTCSSDDIGGAATGRGRVSAQEVDSSTQKTQPEDRSAARRGGSYTNKHLSVAN